jgi:hypothetical protein
MILIGTMNITRTRGHGDFHCPTCGSLREYSLKSRRPFLTLYFIPTVPIGASELFVRCDGCKSNWDPAILNMDARDHQIAKDTQFRVEAFRASVLVVLHGGEVNGREIEALLGIGQRILPEPVDRDELGQLCSSAIQNRVSAANYVRSVCRAWSTEQKQLALQAMFVAATADSGLDAKTLALLASLRDAMNLTDDEYQSAIEAAIQWDDAAET